MASIYLAGKIGGRDDWRKPIVSGDLSAGYSFDENEDRPWPVLPSAVLGCLDYTGPYFDSAAHVGGRSHLVDVRCGSRDHDSYFCDPDRRPGIKSACLDAIDHSDIVFAWLDDPTAHGTLVEIGYAKGRKKRVVVAMPRDAEGCYCGDHDCADCMKSRDQLDHLWFARETADLLIVAPTPREALSSVTAQYRYEFKSPIESLFWHTFHSFRPPALDGLTPQVQAGRYYIDFALPNQRFGIELDGYAYHSSPEQFTNDRKRQRDLETMGWRIIRFSGAEINADVERCLFQAADLARRHSRQT